MRASKLRFPERTAHATRSPSAIACETGSGSGPEFPMHVVQPSPTVWQPSASRYGVRPARSKYSLTTLDPGARLDFTQGFRSRPRSTAFFARRPAATMTEGFEVFVQEVIAAITTAPWERWTICPSSSHGTPAVH